MSYRKSKFVDLTLMLVFAASVGFAQSLGEFARQQREQRAKEAKQPVKIYTNDNLPAHAPGEGPTAATGFSTSPSAGPPTTPAEPAPPTTDQGATGSSTQAEPSQASHEKPEDKKKTKEYWQSKFKSAREGLARAEEEQRLAEDELNLLEIQQVREVAPDVQSEIGGKITAKKAEVETKRVGTATARKALEDLEKEFKDSGAPEDWSKTES